MSIYNFAPGPSVPCQNEDYVTWEDGFSFEELDAIETYCERKLQQSKATIGHVGSQETVDAYRSTSVGWIELNEETSWFYDKMAYIARHLNAQFYRFDLTGFQEHMQYTVYNSKSSDHYDWHVDAGAHDTSPRKFSMVLQLTDPYKYTGGDLLLRTGRDDTVVRKQRGLISAFPSFRLHKVTPVTSGIRKTIVVWVTGPAFR